MQQQDLWKEEANQLKKDLATRQKQVIKREVEVRLPGQTPRQNKAQASTHPQKNDTKSNDFLRRQLGL
jgi:hypothetical protein